MEHETYVFRNGDDGSNGEKIKKIVFLAAVIVAVAVIAGLFLLLFSRCEKPEPEELEEKPSFALYLKAGEMNYTDTKTNLRLSETLKTMADPTDYSFSADRIAQFSGFTYVSKDGKRVFFGDRVAVSDDGVYLYYMDTDQKDAAPVLIAKDVAEYTVSEDAERVVYLDRSGGLYICDLKESKLISKGVDQYLVSPDGKRVFLRDENANLYSYRQGGKLTLMTETLILRINGADSNFETVYYTDMYNNILRQKQSGLPVTVIEGDETSLLNSHMYSFSSGDAYFVCKKTGSTEANEVWYMAADGGTRKLPLENAGTVTCLSSARNNAAAFFEVKQSDGGKTAYYVATGPKLTKIYESEYTENIVKAEMNEEGTELYFSEIYYAKTYYVGIDGIAVSNPVLLGEMMDSELRGFCGEDLFAVYSWQSENGGASEKGVTLFKEGVAVARLRDTYAVKYCEATDAFCFISGYNEKTAKGTLMMYKENELTELEKDVFDFTVTQKGDILFTKEYDTASKQGNLYLYSEEESVCIDRGVTKLVECTDETKKIWE